MSIPNNHTLTVAGLIELLSALAPETPVYYRDENFGGEGERFTPADVTVSEDSSKILIRSPYWTDIEESL